jgi:hypothetical protein
VKYAYSTCLSGTRLFVTDRYLRYWCARFFYNEFGFRLRIRELLRLEDYTKPAPEECYEAPDVALVKLSDDVYPRITFHKLCAFKLFVTERGWMGLGRRERK